MLYFLEDGRIFKLNEHDLLLKQWQELEYNLYLMKSMNASIRRWAERINRAINEKQNGTRVKSGGTYISKYILDDDSENEMVLDCVQFETTFYMRDLFFNTNGKKIGCMYLDESARQNPIYNIRAAIYYTGDATQELVEVKEQVIQALYLQKRSFFLIILKGFPYNFEIVTK